MKKFTSILLIAVLCLSMLTGCRSETLPNPYSDMDLSEYITLPDYLTYTVGEPEVSEATEAEVEAEIQAFLESYASQEKVTEGVVEEGDYLLVDFTGTLADGTTEDGMNAEDTTMGPVGNAGFIDGFEDGLIGAAVGETVTLNLQFPDPYDINKELSGQPVTFEVTVKAKLVDTIPELTDELVAAATSCETVEEYRVYVKEQLEQEEYDSQLESLKNDLYNRIIEETELLKYPEGRVEEEIETVTAGYESIAAQYGYAEWGDFRDAYFQMDQAEFEEQVKLYAELMVKAEMVIYAVAEKEGISLTEAEYEEELASILEASGYADDADFEAVAGMTIREYADENQMDRDILLTRWLDKVYDRLEKE